MYNSRPLTNDELANFKDRFEFKLLKDNDGIFILWERKKSGKGCYVRLNNKTKIVLSDTKRKYTISNKAIDLWINKYNLSRNLFDIQQALLVQNILSRTESFIDNYLDNPNITIKII